jgi:hypothetical protein
MIFWILIVADALSLIGVVILLRTQSPYSNAPLNPQTRLRLRMARSVLLAGQVVAIVGLGLHYWG